ncbi:MAG: hypothetical protein O2890_09070 [Cyanobacteria bacterium]|nr:hypothetical protein [Cyanobacteriota bacterium]
MFTILKLPAVMMSIWILMAILYEETLSRHTLRQKISNLAISRDLKNMGINWHDVTILDGDFNPESNELKLLVELNSSLQDELQSSADNFISGFCIFKAVRQSSEILNFLNTLSQGENIDADVISYEVAEKNGLISTTLHMYLVDFSQKTKDFLSLEIYSESCEFQIIS